MEGPSEQKSFLKLVLTQHEPNPKSQMEGSQIGGGFETADAVSIESTKQQKKSNICPTGCS